MKWDFELTDEQKIAASFLGGHSRLLAGPGTGKTRCISSRIQYLIQEKGIDPSEILVLTFTRAARAELQERIKGALNNPPKLPHVCTLHSFSLETILRKSTSPRFPSPFRVADDFEERWIIDEDIKRILQISKIKEVKDLFNLMSSDWEQSYNDWEKRSPNPNFVGAFREHRNIFGYTLRNELVFQLKCALEEKDIIFDKSPKYVLVDEYQDLNQCDLQIIDYLAKSGSEVYSAGDDDQSIYSFRYAYPDGIRDFLTHFKPSTALELTECKRCDEKILNLGNYLVKQDTARIDKKIVPSHTLASDSDVRVLSFENQYAESQSIAKLCKYLIEKKGILPDEILILLRNDFHNLYSSIICKALSDDGIKNFRSMDPLEPLNYPIDELGTHQKEGRVLLCLLRLAKNPVDHLSWRTILQLRKTGIGPGILDRIYALARQNGASFCQTLQEIISNPLLLSPYGELLASNVKDINEILSTIRGFSAPDLATTINLIIDFVIQNPLVKKEVTEIFSKLIVETQVNDTDEFLNVISSSLGDVEQEKQDGAINIMTMHQAKGLSAKAVIIMAAEQEVIPGSSTGQQAFDELRLLFVSVTRAMHFLYITYCINRIDQQSYIGSRAGSSTRHLSTFLSGGPIKPESGSNYVDGLL